MLWNVCKEWNKIVFDNMHDSDTKKKKWNKVKSNDTKERNEDDSTPNAEKMCLEWWK